MLAYNGKWHFQRYWISRKSSKYPRLLMALEFRLHRDFVGRLSPMSCGELETVWLRDVIQLKAYLIWEKKGGEREQLEEFRKGDYLDACEFYRRRLADQDIKQGLENFGNLREYLQSKYFDATGETLREEKTRELISTKAR